ncbi:MAG: ADP-ribosylglycohydrolase family protein [Gemmatimonadota bacterium]
MTLPGMPAAEVNVERREGFRVGGVVGAALAAGEGGALAPPPGRRRAATALPDALLVELLGGGVDLRRLAGRWLEWQRDDAVGADPLLALALDHLREFDAPIAALPSGSIAAVAAVLPAALASASPRAMIAGSFHVARMLDPDESTALAAMALVIAASAFLDGRRDFVPDVVAALRANDASAALIEAVRTIPRDPQAPPPMPHGINPDPVRAVTWLLWQAHHRPRSFDVLHELAHAADVAPSLGAMTGALFGARDGMTSWPPEWIDGAGEEVVLRRAAARRLGGT